MKQTKHHRPKPRALKPAAFLTIDDRAVCFDGTFPTTEQMLNFKPWYKKD